MIWCRDIGLTQAISFSHNKSETHPIIHIRSSVKPMRKNQNSSLCGQLEIMSSTQLKIYVCFCYKMPPAGEMLLLFCLYGNSLPTLGSTYYWQLQLQFVWWTKFVCDTPHEHVYWWFGVGFTQPQCRCWKRVAENDWFWND